ncbi:Ferrochelatase, protoheme ferro-lyase [Labilithrix luteola]|uniref:Ferrochelatase n=1 Tax=Labilithrix luteola TaxID=1391654 RepID=A0A0K1QCU1_9BACT|nr:ferrochelatase [Labilithrix luteola]AKV03548.1 Ferrochelatase, protoheme ferro-lyase [Labilithrix luteola]
MTDAVVLVAHGTVDALSDLPEFLKNIRRGHAAPPDLLAEVRRRYEAIGGSSPLNAINRALARAVGERLGSVPVRFCNRLFRPYPKDVLSELFDEGVRRACVIPLAQHSSGVYGAAMTDAAREVGDGSMSVVSAPNWGRDEKLTEAFASTVMEAFARVPADESARTALVLTAHSLPVSVIEAGDPYEAEFRGSAEAVVAAVRARGARFAEHAIAFQSQGMSTGPGGRPMAWMGPDLKATLEALAARGVRHVVVAPIGFLADHVEILYDLDIEARAWCESRGMSLYRSDSLNDRQELVDVLVGLAHTTFTTRLVSVGEGA